MKIRSFIAVILLVCFAAGAGAQRLWRVTSPDGSRVSYIFGTHHLAPLSVIDNTPGLVDALNKVDKVIGEIDLSPENTALVQTVMQKYMQAPADSMLSVVLKPAELDSVVNVLQAYFGPVISAPAINRLTPAAVGLMLSMQQAAKAFPQINPAQQLDMEMQNRARALGKAVGGLETVESQCKVLLGGSLAEQAQALMFAVRNDSRFVEAANQFSKAYMDGDLLRLLQLMTDPATGYSESDGERLIYSRNSAWVEILTGVIPAMSVLVVVGAGHLPGDRGVLALLEAGGMKVEPVNNAEK